MPLPADSHVHSEWSWDAPDGSMEATCARAVEIGLPAVAFTDHADYTTWEIPAGDVARHGYLGALVAPGGSLTPPELDLSGYLESVRRCRDRYPALRIITGVELGEPHRHRDVVARVLAAGEFDRVLGSLHCLPEGQRFAKILDLYRRRKADDVVRDYLSEVTRVLSECDSFAVLAHIDYPVRYWPAQAGPFDPSRFEDEFRQVLGVLADSDRALEINTRVPLHPEILRWWRQEGGTAVTFGSDAHDPTALAHGFGAAAAMAEAHGFRAGRHPFDFWTVS